MTAMNTQSPRVPLPSPETIRAYVQRTVDFGPRLPGYEGHGLLSSKLSVDPSRATVAGHLRAEPGRGGLELQTYIYPGGHAPPPEVPKLVVDFFRRHTLSGD
jgi:hypothetical protein